MTIFFQYDSIKIGDKVNNKEKDNNNNYNNNNNQSKTLNNKPIFSKINQITSIFKDKKKKYIFILLIILVIIIIVTFILKNILVFSSTNSIHNINNKSKLLSISSTSQTVANSINIEASEERVSKNLTKVYSESFLNKDGYNLDTFNGEKVSKNNPAIYYISQELNDVLSVSSETYILSNYPKKVTDRNKITASFFTYTGEETIVCLLVNKESNDYIKVASLKKKLKININDNLTVSFPKGTMFSCSNNQKSWEDINVNTKNDWFKK